MYHFPESCRQNVLLALAESGRLAKREEDLPQQRRTEATIRIFKQCYTDATLSELGAKPASVITDALEWAMKSHLVDNKTRLAYETTLIMFREIFKKIRFSA